MRARNHTRRIIIHCSATRPDWMAGEPLAAKVKEIERWHLERGFAAIGYHYIDDRNGEIASGRAEGVTGAHVAHHNHDSIGICLLGGFGSNANDRFEEHFTDKQRASLEALIAEIRSRYDTPLTIHGHNEYAAKACPGFRVNRYFK